MRSWSDKLNQTKGRSEVKPRGVLRVSYFVNCGDCGMQSQHLPDVNITSWEKLEQTLTRDGVWRWSYTTDRGWVCGCKSREEARKATAIKKTVPVDDDIPF